MRIILDESIRKRKGKLGVNKIVFITGADRGLGFALVKDFLDRGYSVCAGQFMAEWKELDALKKIYKENLFLVPLDVSDLDSINQAYELVSGKVEKIDILINNAGISGSAGDIMCLENVERGLRIFQTNCLGPLAVVNTFLPLMLKEDAYKRLCFITSEAGSISVCHREDGFIYPMSKSGLNMTVKLLFEQLRGKGFTFRLYNPGWMKSYMSGKKSTVGKIEPEESSKVAINYFVNDLIHEDVLKVYDNNRMVWPF